MKPHSTALAGASLAATGAAFAATAWHIARNAAPPAWDDAWYLETSFRLWMALKSSPLAFARAYVDAFHIKAPLISLLPLPLYGVFGPGERVAVWANLPLAAIAAWAWYRAAAEWWRAHPRGRDAAMLGGALTALVPLAYGLSRLFFAETLVSCLLALFAWRCAAAKRDDRVEGVRLGVLLGLGLLAKVTFPLFAAGFVWSARERLKSHARFALSVAALIAATWYAANAPYVLGFAWSAGFGRVARDYAGAGGFAVRRDWLLSILRDGFSWPLSAAMATVAAAAAAAGPRHLDAGARTAFWGLSPLLIYAAGVNHELRMIAPLLAIPALLAARAAVSLPRSGGRALASAALLATGLWTCAEQTFPARSGRPLAYNGAPSPDAGWDRGALVDAVVRAGGSGAVAAVTLEYRLLNANNLSSEAAARGLPLRFISLGYAQDSVEAALIRLTDHNVSILILVEGLPDAKLPAFLNRVNAGVADAVRSGRLAAVATGRVALSPGVSARVFRLTR